MGSHVELSLLILGILASSRALIRDLLKSFLEIQIHSNHVSYVIPNSSSDL